VEVGLAWLRFAQSGSAPAGDMARRSGLLEPKRLYPHERLSVTQQLGVVASLGGAVAISAS
jgi:hypothetical protein